MPEPSVVIIGGGISGLATAFYLGRRGVSSVLIEKSNRLGGLIKTDILEGCHLGSRSRQLHRHQARRGETHGRNWAIATTDHRL